MADKQDDRRYLDPPSGFVVARESEIDPDEGRADRWLYRGIVDGRSVIRSDMHSRSAACRAAWFVVDDLLARGETPVLTDVADADAVVAEVLARRHALARERLSDRAEQAMRESYRVERDTWAAMTAALLEQVIADAGSVRKAARLLDLPRSTLAAWVRGHRERGTWPERLDRQW